MIEKFCKSCKVKIVFLPTKAGKTNPVNWDSLLPEEKAILEADGTVMFIPKSHQMTHFATCPDSPMYRRKK